ncbi:MAG: DUF1080 domain-containing protein [Opitutus sp.]
MSLSSHAASAWHKLLCQSSMILGWSALLGGPMRAEQESVALFNGRDLSGWEVYVAGETKPVVNQTVFTVTDGSIQTYQAAENGTKQPFGMLVTKQEYADYHLSLEYRWGEKKFAPRSGAEFPRDAGVCYHVQGPMAIWPTSIECQIQTGDTGDIWVIKAQATSVEHPDTRGFWELANGAVEVTRGKVPLAYHRFIRRACLEREGWNRVEVMVRGDEATHLVNGQVVNRATKMKRWDEATKTWVPLTRGRILLQAEGAEIFYRNVTLMPLK